MYVFALTHEFELFKIDDVAGSFFIMHSDAHTFIIGLVVVVVVVVAFWFVLL